MTHASEHTIDSLFAAIHSLPIDDQYALYNRLQDELHGGPDSEDEETFLSLEWQTEIKRRIADCDSGFGHFTPAEEVIAEARASRKRSETAIADRKKEGDF